MPGNDTHAIAADATAAALLPRSTVEKLNAWAENELEADDERAAIQDVEDAEEARPKPIDWLGWEGRTPSPRIWWIQDWLGPSPTLLSGAGGSGKSTIKQTISTSLAIGREYLAATTQPLRVLMWACEDDENEIVRRQDAICAHFGIERADLQGKLYIEPRQGFQNTLFDIAYGTATFTSEYHFLKQQVNDLNIDVVVLDNIGQVYGGNENDRHQVTVFVNGLHGMVRGRPFAPVLLGHVARTQGSEFAGSAAWENAVRMRWYLGHTLPDQKPDDDDGHDRDVVYLARRKANYTDKDWRRFRFRDGLFVPDEAQVRQFGNGYREEAATEAVLSAFTKLLATGIKPTDSKNATDYLPKQIVAKGFGQGHNRRELESAMHRLMAQGRLSRQEIGKYGNRTPKYGLVISP
jgi:RecA-family ATPase